MAFELQGDLLGLGSIVRLETDSASGLFVVLARGALRPDADKDQVIARYLVGPHPYGEAPDHETFPIVAGDIEEVVFAGYLDSADAAFLEDLLTQMEHGRRPASPAQQFKESLTAVPDATAPGEVDEVQAARDPFFELRKLIGGKEQEQDR